MIKRGILGTLITIVGFWALIAGLYISGWDIITCTGTGPMTYSNGIETIESTDYYYTPVFHNDLITVHKDTVHYSIDKYYMYNIYTGTEYTIGTIGTYVLYIFLLMLLVIIVNKVFEIKKKNKSK